ncbi:MAG TPA: ADP compounds hydrolase NudE [Chromatiales bacterium]|nr:ADP compounds hydrolase NudE [Chromatiales bacterium]
MDHRPTGHGRTGPRIVATRTLARTRIFHVQELELRFPNGTHVRYERLDGGGRGAVLVVPLRDPDTLLLVREYAAGTERYELGFPKGRIESGEDALTAAGREMREEIGYGARRLTALGALTIAPGYIRAHTHVVLARDLYEAPLPGDEPEPPEVVPWPLDDLSGLLERPDLSEARTLAALLLTREHLRREGRG